MGTQTAAGIEYHEPCVTVRESQTRNLFLPTIKCVLLMKQTESVVLDVNGAGGLPLLLPPDDQDPTEPDRLLAVLALSQVTPR